MTVRNSGTCTEIFWIILVRILLNIRDTESKGEKCNRGNSKKFRKNERLLIIKGKITHSNKDDYENCKY